MQKAPETRPRALGALGALGTLGALGALTGWVVMAVLIALVAAVVQYARRQTTSVATSPLARRAKPADIPGFRSNAWFLPDDEMLGFVEIPGGAFVMGSDPAKDPLAFDNERWSARAPQGTVDVPSFYIGRFEVTIAQFGAFVDATSHRITAGTLDRPPTHPVAWVSWPDALAYCRWLEARLKEWSETPPPLKRALQEAWRMTLPTEAEWEKAARGGDERIYPWGNEPRRDRANFGRAGTMPVGSLSCPECAFGLRDMSGNVWEWTRSPYEPYPYDPADDHRNLDADALWVMRGGHYGDSERNVRAAVRGGADPGVRRPFIGFRVVISRSPKKR